MKNFNIQSVLRWLFELQYQNPFLISCTAVTTEPGSQWSKMMGVGCLAVVPMWPWPAGGRRHSEIGDINSSLLTCDEIWCWTRESWEWSRPWFEYLAVVLMSGIEWWIITRKSNADDHHDEQKFQFLTIAKDSKLAPVNRTYEIHYWQEKSTNWTRWGNFPDG